MSDNRGTSSRERLPAGLAFTVLAALIWLVIWRDFGISWDQSVDLRFGQAVLRYFSEGLNQAPISEYPVSNLKFYSPLVSLLAAFFAALTGANLFSSGAGVIGVFWVATFWPVCSVANFMGGRTASWFSGLALLAMPTYLGHGFINAKDLPFACAVAWFLLATLWATRSHGFRWRESISLGVAFGFVLAVRPGGFFVGALFLLPLIKHGMGFREVEATWNRRVLLRVCLWLVFSAGLAWVVMVAPWPTAHKDPILHPLQSMLLASKFNEAYPVLFNGTFHQSNKLPWNYFFVYFLVTTPPFLLLMSLLGQVRMLSKIWSGRDRFQTASILFLIWFPLSAFVLLRMNVYDGIRHFLFLLPQFAITAGIGGFWLASLMPKFLGHWRPAIVAALLASSLPDLFTMHPYQYSYYNFLAGPRSTVHERFETDYWVTSYREAAEWIKAKAISKPRIILAANSFSEPAFLNFAPKNMEYMSILQDLRNEPWPENADYFVGTVRYGQFKNFSSTPVVLRIERGGVLMSVIKSRHP